MMPSSINADAPPMLGGTVRDAPKSADGKFRNAYAGQHMSHPAMMNGYMTQGPGNIIDGQNMG